ncbi:hypothetical protein J4206_07615, partial [Candidatus Woesearchaeota archaeon]|nr:hypothetical protein [Candidatus Woesearchaeota archaeon]
IIEQSLLPARFIYHLPKLYTYDRHKRECYSEYPDSDSGHCDCCLKISDVLNKNNGNIRFLYKKLTKVKKKCMEL